MAIFTYKAQKANGETYEESGEFADRFALYNEIKKKGEMVLFVHEAKKARGRFSFDLVFGRVSLHEQILFARNLGSMISAGLSLTRSLNVLLKQTKSKIFQAVINKILEEIYDEQKRTGEIISVSEFIKILGKEINNKDSILYWCWKNDIKVYCPAITDGSTGDMVHFFMYKNPDLKMDIFKDIHDLNEYTTTRKKTGIIILGKGIMKHHICNANLMRNGADYAVYINTGEEWDGADSNARPDEAVSWGKIQQNKGEAIKVFGDATIFFPLLVAKTFAK